MTGQVLARPAARRGRRRRVELDERDPEELLEVEEPLDVEVDVAEWPVAGQELRRVENGSRPVKT